MYRLFRIWFLGLFLLSCCLAAAQDRNLDRALDRYEAICDRCIDLRLRASSGEAVSSDDLKDLLVELNDLKNMLQNAGYGMSPSQKARFEGIRLRYAEVFGPKRSPLLKDPFPPVMKAFVPIGSPVWLPRRKPVPYSPPVVRDRQASRVHTGLLLYGGLPDGYAGLMAQVRGKAIGGFVKGSLTPRFIKGAYSCTSDGFRADGGYIWTSGKENLSRSSLTGGVLLAPFPWMECYAGAGYGRRAVFWEDVSGKWATVSDLSRAGICTDAGLILTRYRISALVGISAIRFRSVSVEIGLGVIF
jgi:hypothetical protein